MSLLIDINRHTIFGPIHREGVKEGMERGMEKGMEKGRLEGAQVFAIDLLTQRFGTLSPTLTRRIQNMSEADLAKLRARLFDARSLTDLLP